MANLTINTIDVAGQPLANCPYEIHLVADGGAVSGSNVVAKVAAQGTLDANGTAVATVVDQPAGSFYRLVVGDVLSLPMIVEEDTTAAMANALYNSRRTVGPPAMDVRSGGIIYQYSAPLYPVGATDVVHSPAAGVGKPRVLSATKGGLSLSSGYLEETILDVRPSPRTTGRC